MEKNPLYIAIITKNEEENILYYLQSISFIRQIVVDSGSTDKTLKIAAESGCEVYTEEWHGFCPHSTLGSGTVFRKGKSSTISDFVCALFTFVQDYFPVWGFWTYALLDACLIDMVNKIFKYTKLSELKKRNLGGGAPLAGSGGFSPQYEIPRIEGRMQFPARDEDVLLWG